MATLLVLTAAGVWRYRQAAGNRWDGEPVLTGAHLAALAAGPGPDDWVLAGGAGGVHASADGGGHWRAAAPLPHPVTSLALSAADGAWYAGTEPSHVFRSRTRGAGWEELAGLRDVPSRPRWSFPPRPWTHHVAALAPHPRDPDALLAGIELGGVMATDDGGATFRDHAQGAHRDCHVLLTHPRASGRAYQGAGEGAAVSDDGGRTWRPCQDGLLGRYVTAAAVDEEDPDLWYVASSPSAGHAWYSADAQACLYAAGADGRWRLLSGRAAGLPDAFSSPVVTLAPARGDGGRVYALLQDGSLWAGRSAGEAWEALSLRPPPAGRSLDLAVL